MGEKESQRKRYALVGTGGRSSFYYTAIASDYKSTSEIVGLCDTNQTRMDVANEKLETLGHGKVPTFLAVDFDKMITTLKPDEVIVTAGPDRLHNIYIVRAMELGCNVVTEKPSEFAHRVWSPNPSNLVDRMFIDSFIYEYAHCIDADTAY